MLRHATPRHIHIPDRSKFTANWNEIERFSRGAQNGPFCVGALGDPGTIAAGAPGVLSQVTWQPVTNPLYDLFNIVGPVATKNLRIPIDGFYNFWCIWNVNDNPATTTEIEVRVEVAPTSNSGIGSPVFAQAGDRFSKTILSTNSLDRYLTCDWKGIELHANDLLRFSVRINGPVAFTNTDVESSQFEYVAPIPVER